MMLIGFVALAYGFYSAPHSIEEAKEMVSSHGHEDHGSDQGKDYNSKSAENGNKIKKKIKTHNNDFDILDLSSLK